MQKNVSSTGGLFAPMPTEMEGNIVNLTNPGKAVIGYALIVMETTKRMYIDVMDVLRMREVFPDRCIDEADLYFTDPEGAYNNGWGIYEWVEVHGRMGYTYRKMECVDCRLLGGSKRKPTFWPTDHM